MDFTLSELPFFPEGSPLSELPFFCEDSVENSFLPPRPSTVCDACWEGPFAVHLGLPLVSPRNGQLYRRWLKEISYSTSLAKLQSRADGGCAWCRLVLRHASAYNSSYNERVTITVKGSSHTSDEDSDQSQSFQKLTVHVSNMQYEGVHYFVYTDLGALGIFRRFQAERRDEADARSHQITPRQPTSEHEAPSGT